MSSKNDLWEKILIDSSITDEFSKWFNDSQSASYFEIPNVIFKEVGALPGKIIPHYNQNELPQSFKSRSLELFRHIKGGCVLTKTGPSRPYKTIFPEFPECKLIRSKPFNSISSLSLLFRKEIQTEENFFFLSQRIGVLGHYVSQINPNYAKSPLNHYGRIQGSTNGKISIGNDLLEIKNANLELDHILENDNVIIALELKKSFSNSMSYHQLLFPYFYLAQLNDQRPIMLIYFQASGLIENSKVAFRLYSVIFENEKDVISLEKSKILFPREYQIMFS